MISSKSDVNLAQNGPSLLQPVKAAGFFYWVNFLGQPIRRSLYRIVYKTVISTRPSQRPCKRLLKSLKERSNGREYIDEWPTLSLSEPRFMFPLSTQFHTNEKFIETDFILKEEEKKTIRKRWIAHKTRSDTLSL